MSFAPPPHSTLVFLVMSIYTGFVWFLSCFFFFKGESNNNIKLSLYLSSGLSEILPKKPVIHTYNPGPEGFFPPEHM